MRIYWQPTLPGCDYYYYYYYNNNNNYYYYCCFNYYP